MSAPERAYRTAQIPQQEPAELPVRRPNGLLTVHSSVLGSFCSALLMPTVSAGIGALLFNRVRPIWTRWLYGYLTYISVRSALSFMYRYELLWQRASRQVLDYEEPVEKQQGTGAAAVGGRADAQAAPGEQNAIGNAAARILDRLAIVLVVEGIWFILDM